jgi:Tat protein secretion system quality control protein TatD with DNase activity
MSALPVLLLFNTFYICSHVLEILSAVRDEDIADLSDAIYENTTRLFFS